MKLFLHLELGKWQESGYEKPLLTYASSLSSNLIGAEFDNQSEPSIADLVIKLCDQMNTIFIFIRAQSEEPLGATLKLLNHLLRTNQKIHSVVLSGNHPNVEKLLLLLQERLIKEEDTGKIKTLIKEFASA